MSDGTTSCSAQVGARLAYRFEPLPWSEIDSRISSFAAANPTHRHLAAIVASIRASGQERHLAGLTSMHDLIVRGRPIPDPPVDVVAVRAPGSPIRVPAGMVLIEHLSTNGRDDRIIRLADEAVPLFWRFMIVKFGVDPADG